MHTVGFAVGVLLWFRLLRGLIAYFLADRDWKRKCRQYEPGRWGDEMGDAEAVQGSLELAFGVPVIGAGAWAKEAQTIGVDGFWKAMDLKSTAKLVQRQLKLPTDDN